MTSIRDQQLKKIVVADLSNFDSSTNTYFIPRYKRPRFEEGKSYLVQVANELINNADSVYIVNYNAGRVIKNRFYKIAISKVNGGMLHLDGLAFDPDTNQDLGEFWSGWLPASSLKQLETL